MSAIDVQSVTDGISQRVTTAVDNTPVSYLSIPDTRFSDACYRNVMLLSQFLPAICQIWRVRLSAERVPGYMCC